MKEYVVGFMFSEDGLYVVLIRKNKPEWQSGLLNGIGGKIEEGESPIHTMVREFYEEAGIQTSDKLWSRFHTMQGKDFKVYFYCCCGGIDEAYSKTDEEIEIHRTCLFNPLKRDIVANLSWLIGLAYDHQNDTGLIHSTSEY